MAIVRVWGPGLAAGPGADFLFSCVGIGLLVPFVLDFHFSPVVSATLDYQNAA